MSNWLVIGFLTFVWGILALDLGVSHRRDRLITIREARIWSGFWILIALLFRVGVYYLYKYRWIGSGSELGHELSGRIGTINDRESGRSFSGIRLKGNPPS